ncbi:MAG: insulinase family protein, partial [Chitinophagaceae bacterium]|nr:insulinase family protein [Chitinophagaceae bacterium]
EAKAMVLTDKEATGHDLQIIFPVKKVNKEKTVSDYRDFIVQNLMTEVLNTRLRDLSRSSDPPFPFAYAYVGGWARGYEGLITYASFGDEGPQKAMNALTAELLKAKKFGFNESEIELAKKDVLSGMERSYNERNTTESNRKVGELIRNFLEGELIPGIELEYAYHKKYLPTITVEELNKEVQGWLSNMNFFSLITAPEASKDKLPTDAQLLTMTRKGFEQNVEQTKEEKVAENLLKEKPKGSKVVSTQRRDDLGAMTYKLANDVTVTVKSTEFKSDEVILYGVRKGGRNNYGVKDVSNVQYATQVVDAMGYGDFTPTQIEKTLAGKSIRASVYVGEINAGVSANSTVKDLETMFQLLYLKLTAPRMDKELFEAYKKKQITQLKFLSANPTFAFYDTAINKFYGNNPLAPAPVPKVESFESLNLNRIMQIYNDELGGAEDYHFYIVGNVDYTSIVPLLQNYLGALPKTGKKHESTDNGLRPITGHETFKFHKGSDPKSMILGFTYGDAKFSEDFYLKVNALAQVLDIRVIEELREKLSGIYGGGYRASVEKEPYENYSLVLQLPCGPENVDKLLKAADEVVAEIKKDGPKSEDLQKVKNQWHEQHRENMEKNSYWAGRLRHVLFYGRDANNFLKYDEWIDKLTVQDIKDVANMVFGDKSNTYTAILYPEEGAGDEAKSSEE